MSTQKKVKELVLKKFGIDPAVHILTKRAMLQAKEKITLVSIEVKNKKGLVDDITKFLNDFHLIIDYKSLYGVKDILNNKGDIFNPNP